MWDVTVNRRTRMRRRRLFECCAVRAIDGSLKRHISGCLRLLSVSNGLDETERHRAIDTNRMFVGDVSAHKPLTPVRRGRTRSPASRPADRCHAPTCRSVRQQSRVHAHRDLGQRSRRIPRAQRRHVRLPAEQVPAVDAIECSQKRRWRSPSASDQPAAAMNTGSSAHEASDRHRQPATEVADEPAGQSRHALSLTQPAECVSIYHQSCTSDHPVGRPAWQR